MKSKMQNNFHDYVIDFAYQQKQQNNKIALITLIGIEGSAPRMIGSQMVVTQTGDAMGYLSGGCVEQAVIAEAISAIQADENRLVRYGAGSDYMDIHLPCGSAIDLYFDTQISLSALENIHQKYQQRKITYLCIDYQQKTSGQYCEFLPSAQDENLCYVAYPPPLRLVIIGSGPVAIKLAKIAILSEFDIVFYSPDDATHKMITENAKNKGVITNHHLLSEDIFADDVANGLIDAHTAIAVLFHDHEWEMRLLPILLATDAFYIGAMGSKITHHNRCIMLGKKGISAQSIDKIHAPAGLFLSGRNAHDIAISIVAQIVQLRP